MRDTNTPTVFQHSLLNACSVFPGERPYKCPLCPKTFATRDTLTKHQAAHSDERNYVCGECSKSFKRISHVREHLKSHSQDRPFVCRVCEKGFKTSVSARQMVHCPPIESFRQASTRKYCKHDILGRNSSFS